MKTSDYCYIEFPKYLGKRIWVMEAFIVWKNLARNNGGNVAFSHYLPCYPVFFWFIPCFKINLCTRIKKTRSENIVDKQQKRKEQKIQDSLIIVSRPVKMEYLRMEYINPKL